MRKTWIRLIAAFLTVIMVVTAIPTPVLAYMADKPDMLSVPVMWSSRWKILCPSPHTSSWARSRHPVRLQSLWL